MKRIIILLVVAVFAAAGISGQERTTIYLAPFAGGMMLIDSSGGSGIAEGGPVLGVEADYAIGKHWGLGLRGFSVGLFSRTEPFQFGWGGESITVQYYLNDAIALHAHLGLPSGIGVTAGHHDVSLEAFPAQNYFVLLLSYGYRFRFRL